MKAELTTCHSIEMKENLSIWTLPKLQTVGVFRVWIQRYITVLSVDQEMKLYRNDF